MILVVGNIKGGVGKTVLAANIAAVLAQRGDGITPRRRAAEALDVDEA